MLTSQPKGRACRDIRVVLVDDEPAFRTSLAEMLTLDGHTVSTFASVGALPPPMPPVEHFDVLVTDYELPDGNGISLADTLHAYDPSLSAIVVTAHRTVPLDALVAARGFASLVEKPVSYEALHEHIHRCVGGRDARCGSAGF